MIGQFETRIQFNLPIKSNAMMLNVLIFCYNDSVGDVPQIFLPERGDVRYLVSHQMSEEYAVSHSSSPFHLPQEPLTAGTVEALGRADVVYSPFVGKGVSQNRNHALHALTDWLAARSGGNMDGQICILADDDVRYGADMPDRIMRIVSEYPEYDAFWGKIATPDGQSDFKPYPRRSFEIHKVPVYGRFYSSSIEIFFRLAPVAENGLRFDERFGLGSSVYPEGGEESVFLSDCLKAGLRLRYVPEYIVMHPYMSTGKSEKTVRKALMMEAVAVRCRGRLSSAALIGRLRVLYRRLLSSLHLL